MHVLKSTKGLGYKIKIVCPSPTNATFQLLSQDWPISFENKHNNTQCTRQQKIVTLLTRLSQCIAKLKS